MSPADEIRTVRPLAPLKRQAANTFKYPQIGPVVNSTGAATCGVLFEVAVDFITRDGRSLTALFPAAEHGTENRAFQSLVNRLVSTALELQEITGKIKELV